MASRLFGTVAVWCLLAVVASAHLDYSRVHLVDQAKFSSTTNFLFRGNMPTNSSHQFAYEELLQYMKQRVEEAGGTFPSKVYMIDISLNNIFDGEDFYNEEKFWKDGAHADLGRFINWPLGLAGVLPPTVYSLKTVRKLSQSFVWKVDKIPSRVADIHNLLHTEANVSQVIYVHCTAGCDRTGEVIGSYRITYGLPSGHANVTSMYALDCSECGRPPNYFSTSALEWFCYYWTFKYNVTIGNCVGFAKCKPFGSCQPTHPTLNHGTGFRAMQSAHPATATKRPPVNPFVHVMDPSLL